MSVSNKYADTLGLNFSECLDEPPREPKWPEGCPNFNDGPGPQIDDKTGEIVCIKCGVIFGNEVGYDDDTYDDDAIDAENKEDIETAYVYEGDKIVDYTPEQDTKATRSKKIYEIIQKMGASDLEYSIFLSEKEKEIIRIMTDMEKAKEPLFVTRLLTPKILAVASYLIKRLPNSEAIKLLKVKSIEISKRVDVLNALKSPHIEDEVSRNIQLIAQELQISSGIYSAAIESYEKQRPTNSVLNKKVRAAAWLYLFVKKSKHKINKTDIYKIPGISANSFNKAVESYRIFFRNTNYSGIDRNDEET